MRSGHFKKRSFWAWFIFSGFLWLGNTLHGHDPIQAFYLFFPGVSCQDAGYQPAINRYNKGFKGGAVSECTCCVPFANKKIFLCVLCDSLREIYEKRSIYHPFRVVMIFLRYCIFKSPPFFTILKNTFRYIREYIFFYSRTFFYPFSFVHWCWTRISV